MRACLQRVTRASVAIAGQTVSAIGPGLVVLLGIAADDTVDDARTLAEKIVALRCFDDAEGKLNRSLSEANGQMLVVSQFTLLGDCRKGRRPSFVGAAPAELAERLYEHFVACVRQAGVEVATGRFRASMEVALVNDGPVTLLLDSRRLF